VRSRRGDGRHDHDVTVIDWFSASTGFRARPERPAAVGSRRSVFRPSTSAGRPEQCRGRRAERFAERDGSGRKAGPPEGANTKADLKVRLYDIQLRYGGQGKVRLKADSTLCLTASECRGGGRPALRYR
jgi:hypothetical protein